MSLIKKLQLGNNEIGRYTTEYLLKDYQCHTCRHYTDYRPSADKFCERIDMTVIAPGREDVSLYNCRRTPVRNLRRRKRCSSRMPSSTSWKRTSTLRPTECDS